MAGHLPGIRALKTLEAAGRHLNFSRAAAELGLTPAAVSHQIKEFEEQLGVGLFLRSSRSMELTPAGEILHAAATEAVHGLTRAVARIQKVRSNMRLRISASTSIAAKWLVPRLERFMQRWPDVDIRLEVSAALRDFVRDDIDIAFRWGRGQYAGARADRLFEHSIIPVCSPSLLEAKGPLNEARDLLKCRLIHVSWSGLGVTWPDWRMWMLAAGIRDFDDSPGLHFAETGPAIQAAIDGHGVALGDAWMVADDLATGRLVKPFALSIEGPPQFAYYIVTAVEAADDPLIRTFRDWVLEEAANTPLTPADELLPGADPTRPTSR
jgi:LysR family glycine cleavage system transcriptional activator